MAEEVDAPPEEDPATISPPEPEVDKKKGKKK